MSEKNTEARKWLRENNYDDIADMIDEIMSEWKAAGKTTRRNWWEILAGDKEGKPRKVAGREFPVLQIARRRQGLEEVPQGISRSTNEIDQTKWIVERWVSTDDKERSIDDTE